MTVLVFGRISWLAPLVNLLVLPLFNTVTVPAALLGLLLDGPFAIAGDSLLRLSWHSVRLTLSLIDVVSAWPPARVHIATPTGIMLFVVMLAALPAFLPPGFPGRKLAWIAAVATLLFKPAAPPGGCVDLVALAGFLLMRMRRVAAALHIAAFLLALLNLHSAGSETKPALTGLSSIY